MDRKISDNTKKIAKRLSSHRWITLIKKDTRKSALVLLAAVAAACILSVLAQVVYPSGRALPGTQLAGHSLTFKSRNEVKKQLAAVDRKTFTMKLAGKSYQITPTSVGLSFASDENTKKVLNYPLSGRLIPFSAFFQNQAAAGKRLAPAVDKAKLQKFADQTVTQSNTLPAEGVIKVNDGKVNESAPKPGSIYSSEQIIKALSSLSADVPRTLAIQGRPVPPSYTAEAVHTAAQQAAGYIKPFNFTVNSVANEIPAAEVGSWLVFTPNSGTKAIDISFNKQSIGAYLDSKVAKQFYKAPTNTVVALLDGQQIDQQTGTPGVHLDTAASSNLIAGALGQKQTEAKTTSSPLASPITYNRNYSSTSTGLSVLIKDWVAAHGGASWGIAVTELGGKSRSGGANETKSFFTASINKLYISYTAQKKISEGSLDPASLTSTGQPVSTCLEIMITKSDNNCAQALGSMVTWDKINDDAHAAGFSATQLSATNNLSTAQDTRSFLIKLQQGSLLDAGQTTALLNRMKQQVYRSGLPAGSGGATVANKVGFYGYALNDSGIIYGPNSNYVISLFSNGGSWTQIADLASTIANYFNTH